MSVESQGQDSASVGVFPRLAERSCGVSIDETGCRDAGEDIMKAAIVQCPNAGCGRISHLGDDPLGRIFRCPHCLTKLPTAAAGAADPRWTAVLGPARFGAPG